MLDTDFPTVNPDKPYELTEGEAEVMVRLRQAFQKCEKLQRHVKFLFAKGGMYKVYNGNLLYHGCVPMQEDGSFTKVNVYGKEYGGKALYDIDVYKRQVPILRSSPFLCPSFSMTEPANSLGTSI